MTSEPNNSKGPPPIRRGGQPSTPAPGPFSPASQATPSFDDDLTVTAAHQIVVPPSPNASAGPTMGASPAGPADASGNATTSKSGLLKAVGLVAVLCALGAGAFFGRGLLGGEDGRQILLSRGSDVDLYAVESGQEPTRDDRLGRDTSGFGSFFSWSNGSVDVTQQLQIGGRTVGIVIESESSALVDLVSGEELFESSRFSNAVTNGEELFIRETRDGGDRCYQGPIDAIERVSRGGECRFSLTGHLMTVDYDSDEPEINVTAPSGAQLLSGPVVGFPTISSDGAWIIDQLDGRGRVLDVTTGSEVFDEEGYSSSVSGPDGLLMIKTFEDSASTITVIDQSGARAEVASSEGAIEASFLSSGDIAIVESEDERQVVSRWVLATSEREELVDSGGRLRVQTSGDNILVAEADDLGYLLTRFDADGSETLLWEYEGDDMSPGSLRVADDAALISANSSDNGTVVAIVPLDGSSPAFSDEWDSSRFLDYRNGILLFSVEDGSTDIALALTSDAEPVELLEAPTISSGVSDGGRALLTVVDDDQDTVAVSIDSGEPVADLDYSSYSLAEDTDWFIQQWLF